MNVYLAQFNIDHGFQNSKKILFFPYSAGCIWAYANQFEEVNQNYTLKEFFIEKSDPAQIVASLDNPKVFGFSAYIWNCNYSLELAEMVKKEVGEDVKLTVSETDDLRSYHISSEKILRELNFATSRSIRKASADLVKAFSDGLLQNSLNDERYFNIKKMQSIHLE